MYAAIGYSGRVCEFFGVCHYAAHYRQRLCVPVPVRAACVRARMRARVRACVFVHASKRAHASVCSVYVFVCFVCFSLICM